MLKKINRTLLEVQTAILFWMLIALIVGLLLPLESWSVSKADWCLGIVAAAAFAMVSMLHMQRCLERGLDLDEKNATKVITGGYFIRFIAFAVVVIITAEAEVLNPVILCLGYLMILKVAVYSQPFTHKLYNKLFHETDPVPEPLMEEDEVTDQP